MIEKFGVPPDKVVDVQALCGDCVDNVPGAPGIGIKTAAQLINEYGDLDTLLARAGEIKQDKRRQTLIDFADQIRLSRELVRLDCDDAAAVAARGSGGRRARSRRAGWTSWRMEFRTLARRVAEAWASRRRRSSPSAPRPRGEATRAGRASGDAETPGPRDARRLDAKALRPLPTTSDLDDAGARAWIAKARAAGVVAFDTETDALVLSQRRACAASRWRWRRARPATSRSAIARRAAEGARSWRRPETCGAAQIPLEEAIARLKPLLEDPAVLKVGQNIKYDMAVLPRYGIEVAPSTTPC